MGRYDPAIRAWARSDRKVAAAVAQVDRRRVKRARPASSRKAASAPPRRARARGPSTLSCSASRRCARPRARRASWRSMVSILRTSFPKTTRDEISKSRAKCKRAAVEQAMRSPFWQKRIPKHDLEKLDDAEEWRRIPILDKDTLRALTDAAVLQRVLRHAEHDGIAEYWRSGGVTGQPLFYPRSFRTSRSAWSPSRAPSTAPARAAASARTSPSRWASTRSGRSTRAAPPRAASPSTGRARAPRRPRRCSSS